MDLLKIIIFLGSVRENRLGTRVLHFVNSKLAHMPHKVTVFDPMEMCLDLVKTPLHHYEDESQAPIWLREANERIKEADAFLVVSPEYNASIPPPLSNMLDHFPPISFSTKPTGIITYSPGNLGGVRASISLRPFISELGSFPLPYAFIIPEVHNALTSEGKALSEDTDIKAERFIATLVWYAEAIRNQRNNKGMP